MQLVDANVLLHAVNASSPDHAQARAWLDGALAGRDPVAFAWTVLLAFIRIATHPAVFPTPLTGTDAMTVVRAWLAQPAAIVVEPTPRHVDVLAGLVAQAGTAANLVMDAHLAALALEHDAVLVSFDTDFGRFTGLRRLIPGA